MTEGELASAANDHRHAMATLLLRDASFEEVGGQMRAYWEDEPATRSRLKTGGGLGFTGRRGRPNSLRTEEERIYVDAQVFLEKCLVYAVEGTQEKAAELGLSLRPPRGGGAGQSRGGSEDE